MVTKDMIFQIIELCREFGLHGISNGISARIRPLSIDYLSPPFDFLGIDNNPAIFINESTYRLLGNYHKGWEPNAVIAVREGFLDSFPVDILGIIVHEVGHAFNVAAKIKNSEGNAYQFEIETLVYFHQRNLVPFQYEALALKKYFIKRLPQYAKSAPYYPLLSSLIERIKNHTLIQLNTCTEGHLTMIEKNHSCNNLKLFQQPIEDCKQKSKEDSMIETSSEGGRQHLL